MKKIVIWILVILLVGYIALKGFLYIKYSGVSTTKVEFKDYIFISDARECCPCECKTEECNETCCECKGYITYKEFKIKDIFEGYEKEETESGLRYTYRTEEGVEKAILIGIDDTFINRVINSKDLCVSKFKRILKDNNIENDLDLLKYYEVHGDDKVSPLMTISKQSEIYIMKYVNSIMLPSIKYVNEISGGYKGYMLNTGDQIHEVNLLLNDKKYYITFIGDYDLEFIEDTLDKVIIDEK